MHATETAVATELPVIPPHALSLSSTAVRPAVEVPSRTLVVLAGVPGAGKTTLLPKITGQQIERLDPEDFKHIGDKVPAVTYPVVCVVLHAAHRIRTGWKAARSRGIVITHMPATSPTSRGLLLALAMLTRRTPVLLWLDTDQDTARQGQYRRGRVLPPSVFRRHTRNADRTRHRIRNKPAWRGWHDVVVLTREQVNDGLHIDTLPVAPRPAVRRWTSAQRRAQTLSTRGTGAKTCAPQHRLTTG